MRIPTLALAIAAIALPAMGKPPREASLNAAVDAYEQAQMKGDGAALGRLLADDYLLVTSSGAHETKAEFTADLTDPSFKLNPYVVQAPVRRVWPGGAVVAGVARQSGVSAGKPFDACIRFADVWKFVEGRWQVAFTHVARMGAPGAQGCKS